MTAAVGSGFFNTFGVGFNQQKQQSIMDVGQQQAESVDL